MLALSVLLKVKEVKEGDGMMAISPVSCCTCPGCNGGGGSIARPTIAVVISAAVVSQRDDVEDIVETEEESCRKNPSKVRGHWWRLDAKGESRREGNRVHKDNAFEPKRQGVCNGSTRAK